MKRVQKTTSSSVTEYDVLDIVTGKKSTVSHTDWMDKAKYPRDRFWRLTPSFE